MKEKDRQRLEALNAKLQNFVDHPWIMRQDAFHVVGDIYFVGNNYVSSYLLDTQQGLILIDCAFKESAYLLFDNIRSLGYNPKDIKKLFLSHGHFDHCGAAKLVQEHANCEVWLGKEDHFFFSERPDLILFEDHVPRFSIDNDYDYNSIMDFGNLKIRPIHTPGHTPGTTTFFIETIHHGEPVVCAMHGGLGINGLSHDELRENRLPDSLQQEFLNSLEYLRGQHVDVILPSHAHQYDILSRAKRDDGSGKTFFDREGGWVGIIDKHIGLIRELMEPEA